MFWSGVLQILGAQTQTPWSPTHYLRQGFHHPQAWDNISCLHRSHFCSYFFLSLSCLYLFHSTPLFPSTILLLLRSVLFLSILIHSFWHLLQACFMLHKWPLSCLHGWLHHNVNLHCFYDGRDCECFISGDKCRIVPQHIWTVSHARPISAQMMEYKKKTRLDRERWEIHILNDKTNEFSLTHPGFALRVILFFVFEHLHLPLVYYPPFQITFICWRLLTNGHLIKSFVVLCMDKVRSLNRHPFLLFSKNVMIFFDVTAYVNERRSKTLSMIFSLEYWAIFEGPLFSLSVLEMPRASAFKWRSQTWEERQAKPLSTKQKHIGQNEGMEGAWEKQKVSDRKTLQREGERERERKDSFDETAWKINHCATIFGKDLSV